MKKIGLLAIMMFCARLMFAQLRSDSSKVEGLRSFLKLRISWESGLEWQHKIGNFSTLSVFDGIRIGKQSDGPGVNAPLIVTPAAYVEYRSYYNFKKRMAKQRNVENNSADFLYGRVETLFAVQNQNYFGILFAQGWGAQRSLGSSIIVDCHLGIIEHIYYDKPPIGGYNYIKLEPNFDFSISYVF